MLFTYFLKVTHGVGETRLPMSCFWRFILDCVTSNTIEKIDRCSISEIDTINVDCMK